MIEALAGYIKNNMDLPKEVVSLCKKCELDIIMEPQDLTEEEKNSNIKKLI